MKSVRQRPQISDAGHQIDIGITRLFWVGKERSSKTPQGFRTVAEMGNGTGDLLPWPRNRAAHYPRDHVDLPMITATPW
jgi:hypothetical protein